MTGGSLHLERSPDPNFDMASGHKRSGVTYNSFLLLVFDLREARHESWGCDLK